MLLHHIPLVVPHSTAEDSRVALEAKTKIGPQDVVKQNYA